MIFSAPIFLFLFLPLTLICYLITPKNLRNLLLLILSLGFYAFGEGSLVLMILAWTAVNFILGLLMQKSNKNQAKLWLVLAIVVNLGILIYYKYLLFLLTNLSLIIPTLLPSTQSVYLPLAISFFTFHAISYNVDLYRRLNNAEADPTRFTLYMLLFPHLLAGPIIRYHQIKDQLSPSSRIITLDNFSIGASRFIQGLAKKVLIADTLAPIVDEIFAISPAHLTTPEAWLGVICFSLQIYFDFSGYSDMAIGLGRIFGFTFPENFNYPYISTSLTEFWRRWHITLSSWLKDYLYYPLALRWGRNSKIKLHACLLITFVLIGLWHGANWTFIAFGAIQGTVIILESVRNGNLVKWMPRIVRHGNFILVILISWVFFRSENLGYARDYIALMFGLRAPELIYRQIEFFLRNDILLALIAGIFISTGSPQVMFHKIMNSFPKLSALHLPWLVIVFILSIIVIASQTFQSFIYFRF